MTDNAVETRTRFFDHRIPSLAGGMYDITVTQGIDEIDTGSDLPPAAQPFDVRTQRFVLGDDDVRACYPVPGTVGDYKELLAHITTELPALAWARVLPGQERETPWTALLVLREGELPNDPDALGLVEPHTVRALLDGSAGGIPPAIDPDTVFADEWDLACDTVLVPGDLLAAVLPRPAEAALLAHTREGGPPDATHSRFGDEDDPPREEELTSVVVANRFPAPEGRHAVHLVSLEGLEGYLDGTPPDGDVRVVSLWSWSFESEDRTTLGFGDVAHDLATEGLPEGERPDLLLRLRVPDGSGSTDAHRDARERLAGGAVPLPHRLESGELSYAFYRGPLTAAPAQPLPDTLPPRFDSATSALVYLAEYGIFDTTYAAAFTLGRTLALADAEFRRHLLAYRSAARSAARRLVAHPDALGRSAAATAALLRPGAARRSFDRLLTADAGEAMAGALTGAGPALRDGRRRPRVRSTPPPRPRTADLCAQLAEAEARTALATLLDTELAPVTAWLDRLRLLEPVPLSHLVASFSDEDGEGALPPESVRFAHVDPGWVRAAVDGALSVGVGHQLDATLNELAADGAAVPASAVLIRSELIPHWPDTLYTAHDGAGDVVEPLRRADVGEDIGVFLYPRPIEAFAIAEPPQGLHFGVSSRGQLTLRNLDPDQGDVGAELGPFPEEAHAFARFLRHPSDAALGADVVAVTEGDEPLAPAVAAALGLAALTPAQFALEMVNAPELQRFTRP
ncbi:hypothetical protein AB0I72_26360 [Nocardiopsis sp. NPDC049922]|uniref:hypothetical protein n=1 Tax=Nocardiopsis sp. NPDC049922 TaxID=3155157 RepID=UPI003403DA75